MDNLLRVSFHLNQLSTEEIVSYMEDNVMLPHVLRLRTKNRIKLRKEFHQIVKEATNLIRLCCDRELWHVTAFYMVDDTREMFSLRCSELLWFKKVVKSSNLTDWLQKRSLEIGISGGKLQFWRITPPCKRMWKKSIKKFLPMSFTLPGICLGG